MKKLLQLLRWQASNAYVMGRGVKSLDDRVRSMYELAKRHLTRKTCPWCKEVYWTWSKKNYYCGKFDCYVKADSRGGKH